MKTFEDYAYDPKRPLAGVYSVDGLDKLTFMRDRALAKQLFELWHRIHEPRRTELVSRVHRERLHEDQLDVARRAHAGKLGQDEQDLAIELFGLTFPSVVERPLLAAFFRGVAALRHARASRITGEAAE